MQKLLRVIYEFEEVEDEVEGPPWMEQELSDDEIEFLFWHHWMAKDPERSAQLANAVNGSVSELFRQYKDSQ